MGRRLTTDVKVTSIVVDRGTKGRIEMRRRRIPNVSITVPVMTINENHGRRRFRR